MSDDSLDVRGEPAAPRGLTLEQLGRLLGARTVGDARVKVERVAEPERAGPRDLAPVFDRARAAAAAESRAGAFLVTHPMNQLEPRPQLVCADRARALGLALEALAPGNADPRRGVDERAAVDSSARVADDAWIGPFAFVDSGASVGSGARVEPFSYVGAGAVVGRGCVVGPGVTVGPGCILEDEVVLGPGAVVGEDGFGFWRRQDPAPEWRRIPSSGGVVVGQGAQIGANSCVDRGTLGDTRVEAGARIDNLVQVGHNCSVGRRALLCAQVGLAGSVEVGQDAVLGGQVGVADHRRIGVGARVGAGSGVGQDVADAATVTGYPAYDHRAWLRTSVLLPRLGELARRVERLQRLVTQLTDRAP